MAPELDDQQQPAPAIPVHQEPVHDARTEAVPVADAPPVMDAAPADDVPATAEAAPVADAPPAMDTAPADDVPATAEAAPVADAPAAKDTAPADDVPATAEAAPAAPVTAEERAERIARLPQLLDGAEQLLAATDLPDARTRWTALRRDWTALRTGIELDAEMLARVNGIEAQIDARELELREARSRQQHDNLQRILSLCDQLEKTAAGEHLNLRDAERALREARAALDAPGPLPSRQDQQALVVRLKNVQSALFPRVQDLREADEWERWANAGVQESLIRRLEALRDEADVAVIARQLRAVQDEWHKVRAVPREKGRELWQRYKTTEGEIRARCESYFQQVAVERTDNLRQKEALCEQVEALADSTDWIRTAETIKSLQAQWKTIGPVTPGHEKAIWERFRAACDRFFTRRKQDLTERKTVWTVNLQRKEALCAEIEALGESKDWDHALAEVKRLQSEWRLVGPVKRSRADALLLRFRGACEHFFDRYAHRHDQEAAEQAAAREQFCVELETLVAGGGEAVPADEAFTKRVLALKRQFDQGASRLPTDPLHDRFAKALIATVSAHGDAFKGTEIDPEATRTRMEQLCQLVEVAAGEEKPTEQLSPAAILAAKWREALAANTIGGRVDDEARWRNAAEDIRKAQVSWRRLGPVPEEVGREMAERFERACNRFFRQRDGRRRVPGPTGR